MSWIDETWAARAYGALREMLDVEPRLRRDMIQFLLDEGFWDSSLKWDSAVARFNSCLSPNKSEFFKVGEIWALMKRFGRHQLFLLMAEDLGYEVRPRATEERRQALLERLIEAAENCSHQLEEARAELARQATVISGNGSGVVTALGADRPRFSKAMQVP